MKRKEESKRLHAADWILIVLVLAALVLPGIYVVWHRNGVGETVELRCLVCVRAVEDSLLELHEGGLIRKGALVMNGNGTAVLGVVESVEIREHGKPVLRDDVPVWETVSGVSDLEITVRMTGVRREGDGVRVKDLRMAAGGSGSFRFGGYYAEKAEILSVEVTGV